ncbi:MAG: DUF480 domain-containing protein [Fibrobacteria bacterium]
MLIETLTGEEARVLGTLLEKSLATPDYYPMTLNSLRNACNQKSSRDPVTEYDEDTLSLALSGLKRKCLVTFIPYGSQGNTYKYRHFLEDVRFNLGKAELAVFAVLLLRGSQTLNEVKTRASSLHPIASLEAAEAVLSGLAARAEPMVEPLPKRPGWKEPRWRDTVRIHDEAEAVGNGSGEDGGAPESGPAPERSSSGIGIGSGINSGFRPGSSANWDEFQALKNEVAELKLALGQLRETVHGIRRDLGDPGA